jgi:ring-1,2-phenylacetyl-CoA epoxidase subunit PaaD
MAVGRVHLGAARRSRGDLVSERAIQVGVARVRAGAIGGPGHPVFDAVDEVGVRAMLSTIADPELPMVSIVEMGMVGRVDVGPTIRVGLLPTYVGCPAVELIRSTVTDRLAPFGRPVEVRATFEIPWTSDRITPEGLTALRAAGIAPPTAPADARCPYCDSASVVLDSAFGPTPCRSLFYCRACRQPFEAIKPV